MALSMSDSQFATAVSYTVSKVGKTGIVLKVEQLSIYIYIIYIYTGHCHTYRNVLHEFQLYATTAPLHLIPRLATRL